MMMTVIKFVLLGILLLSAIMIAVYDLKYQEIPIWLLLINYISVSCLVDYTLLLGLVVIVLAKIKDFPIDILYLFVMGYLIIIVNSKILAITLIACFLAYALLYRTTQKSKSRVEKIPAMLPLEFGITVLTFMLICPNNWTAPVVSLGQLG